MSKRIFFVSIKLEANFIKISIQNLMKTLKNLQNILKWYKDYRNKSISTTYKKILYTVKKTCEMTKIKSYLK